MKQHEDEETKIMHHIHSPQAQIVQTCSESPAVQQQQEQWPATWQRRASKSMPSLHMKTQSVLWASLSDSSPSCILNQRPPEPVKRRRDPGMDAFCEVGKEKENNKGMGKFQQQQNLKVCEGETQ